MSRSFVLLLVLASVAFVGVGVFASTDDAVAQEEAVPASDHTIIVVHVVRNGHPAPGRVTVRDDDGHETSCEVDDSGECELVGVSAGRHLVEANGPDGAVSGARVIMVPEDGKVSLIVQLPAPPAAD